MLSNWEPRRAETIAAIDAAATALALARGGDGPGEIRVKGQRDVVTTTDVAMEDAVRGILGASPVPAVVGEERGGEVPPDGSPHWLVDPLCGTTNFAAGIPLYCVNLALVEDGQVTVAVAGDGASGDFHVAERGHGAWALRNGGATRLHASEDSGIVVIEEGCCQGERRERAAHCAAAAVRADRWDLRNLGTTLSLIYVAAGRVAAYTAFLAAGLHFAAGSLLATEAGATVTDLDGHPWTVRSDSVIAAATPALHSDLLSLAASPRPSDLSAAVRGACHRRQ